MVASEVVLGSIPEEASIQGFEPEVASDQVVLAVLAVEEKEQVVQGFSPEAVLADQGLGRLASA